MKCGDKTNTYGQTAKDCIYFCHCGRKGTCQTYNDWQDVIHPCVIHNDKYCENYTMGGGK